MALRYRPADLDLIKAIILFRIIEIAYNKVPNPAKDGNETILVRRCLTMLIPTALVALGLIAWPGHGHIGHRLHRQGPAGQLTS